MTSTIDACFLWPCASDETPLLYFRSAYLSDAI